MELIKALVSKDVPLSSIHESTGMNCLMTALCGQQIDIVKKLIDYTIDVKPLN